jgi:hypothetical protein
MKAAFQKKMHLWEAVSLAVLALVVAAAYANTLDSSFHLDDERAIWDNPAVHMRKVSLENLRRAAFDSRISTRPVAHVTFAFNYVFHGLTTRGYHLVNIVIHIAAGILLYFLLKATLSLPAVNREGDRKMPVIVALATTALWLLHPLQTQSVTYIVQRMNSLAALFFLLAMLLYAKGRLAGSTRARWLYWSGFGSAGILALGSKEIAATLPFFIFLYEWYFFRDMQGGFLTKRRNWLPAAVAGFVVVGLVFFYLGANPFSRILSAYPVHGASLAQKLLTEARVVVHYLALLFFPHPGRLTLDYDFAVSVSLLRPGTTLPAVLLLAGMLGFAVWRARANRLYSFCILWFLGNLVVESTFIPLEHVFEHRTYLPATFSLLLVTLPLYSLLARRRPLFYGAFLVIVLFCGFWTFERNKVWHDELTLWQDAAEKSPNKWRVHNNLGREYFRRWDSDKAIYHYRRALQLEPGIIMARTNLASALSREKRFQEAIIELQIVLSKDPGNETARKHLYSNRMFLREQQQDRK